MRYLESADRDQYIMMNKLDDLVCPENPVRLIDALVDSLVLSNTKMFEKERTTEAGRPKYHPSTLLKLYIYGYLNGISSSRKLEAETHRNKEVIWLLGNLCPDHWTISNYRKEHGEEIKYVTKKFREFLREKGYIKLKTVAIDGSKVKANTNRDMLSMEKIDKKLRGIDRKLEEYLEKLRERDIRSELAEEYDDDDDLPPDGGKYIDKIVSLQKQLEDLQREKERLEKENRKYISSSDPSARLMKSRDGKIPAYNVQIAVDAEHKLIADSEVVTCETDRGQLKPMLESLKDELAASPAEVLADKGYDNPDEIEELEKKEEGIKIYVSPQGSVNDKEEIKFSYDKAKDEYLCSQGKRLVLIQKGKIKHKSMTSVYQGIECDGCQKREKCTKSKKGRIINRYVNQQWREDYKKRMQSIESKSKLLKRKTIVEHPFGTIKCLMGKIPLYLRGVKKVATEINLYTTVYNLKRLFNIEIFENLMKEIKNYRWETV